MIYARTARVSTGKAAVVTTKERHVYFPSETHPEILAVAVASPGSVAGTIAMAHPMYAIYYDPMSALIYIGYVGPGDNAYQPLPGATGA